MNGEKFKYAILLQSGAVLFTNTEVSPIIPQGTITITGAMRLSRNDTERFVGTHTIDNTQIISIMRKKAIDSSMKGRSDTLCGLNETHTIKDKLNEEFGDRFRVVSSGIIAVYTLQ